MVNFNGTDWFLKLHKDGENCFTAVLQTKRCIISLRGYNGHFIPRTDNLPTIIRPAKHPACSGQQILQIAAYQKSLLSL